MKRALNRTRRPEALLALLATVLAATAALACKKRVNDGQCEALLDHYATLVVTEKMKDATPDAIKLEQAREREAAKSDDDFKNCTIEVTPDDYACAMKAVTSEALLKCLE
jgi:hypothetical protein